MQCSFNALIRKLEHIHPLTSDEMDALKKSCVRTVRFSANRDLFGKVSNRRIVIFFWMDLFIVTQCLKMVGARYFLFMCLVTFMTLCTSYCLKLITTSPPSPRGTVALVSHQAIIELTEQFPRIARALWKETLIEAAMFREWIASLAAKVPMGGLPI
jgi:hypothetical protein